MLMRFGTVIALFLAVLWTSQSRAQNSVVSLKPELQVPGYTPPIPAKSLDIVDADYPLEALLAGDEGGMTLHVLVDAEGHVIASRVIKSSNRPRLDQAANELAQGWLFQPANRNGQQVVGSRDVDIAWVLPLHRADDIYGDMLGFPVAAKAIVMPRVNPETHRVHQGDYPLESAGLWEEGDVGLRILVTEDGRVRDVKIAEPSGFPRLDQAASSLVRDRFTFTPGSIDGKPAQMWSYELVSFTLSDKEARFCHSRPIIGSVLRMAPKPANSGLTVNQWVHSAADGTVDDLIIETANGWMRASPGLVAKITLHNPPAQFEAPKVGTLFRSKGSRPGSCWYNGEIAMQPL